MNTSTWERNVALILEGKQDASVIVKTVVTVLETIRHDDSWEGACYVVSSILHLLFREQGIASALCLGEVGIEPIAFDHAWIEVNRSPYDLAIAYPLEKGFAHVPVIDGRDLDTMAPTAVRYGFRSPFPPDSQRAMVLGMSFLEFMDNFPAPQGLWGVVSGLGKTLNVNARADQLRRKYRDLRWTVCLRQEFKKSIEG